MVRTGLRRRMLVVPLLSLLLLLPGAAGGDSSPASGAAASSPVHHRPRPEPGGGVTVPAVSGVVDLLAQLLQLQPQPQPEPSVGPVPPAVLSRVAASTVKVSGVACGVRLEGSGFSAAPDTVVTNAHVVAGVTRLEVVRPDGRRLPAQVQLFDPDADLAVLGVPGLGQQPLGLGPARVGGAGAVVGHPEGQVTPEVSPARVVRQVTVTTTNIYDEGRVRREILVVATELEPGDSGAPLVNEVGDVVGVAFAVSAIRPTTAFAVPSQAVAALLAQPRAGPVGTGACLV